MERKVDMTLWMHRPQWHVTHPVRWRYLCLASLNCLGSSNRLSRPLYCHQRPQHTSACCGCQCHTVTASFLSYLYHQLAHVNEGDTYAFAGPHRIQWECVPSFISHRRAQSSSSRLSPEPWDTAGWLLTSWLAMGKYSLSNQNMWSFIPVWPQWRS